MAARLKVFVTSDGLNDYVVAATSRPKALAAWGVRQDLFKEGLAHETADPALVAPATARPGEVLRRPADATGELARLPRRKAAKQPAGPSRAALARVARAERRVEAVEHAHAERDARLAAERQALEARETRERERHAAERSAARAALDEARRALRP